MVISAVIGGKATYSEGFNDNGVTNEGSNMSVYEVGKNIKQEFGLLEAYDMTLEAAVTKTMWILGQTKDPKEIRRLFYQTVNRDILWKSV